MDDFTFILYMFGLSMLCVMVSGFLIGAVTLAIKRAINRCARNRMLRMRSYIGYRKERRCDTDAGAEDTRPAS